jgi:hypothetical protein
MGRNILALSALVFPLVACGGGGSSGGTPPPPVIIAPTPAPPPAPPPSPPPSPTYDTITEFNAARSFSDFGVRLETVTSGGQTTTVSSALQTTLGEVGLNFSINPRSYSVFYGRETEVFSTLSPVTGIFSGESFDNYTDPPTNNLLSTFVRANRVGEQYVGQVRWANSVASFANGNQRSDRNIVRLFAFGISTLPSDLPTAGNDLYQFTFFTSNSRQSLNATMDLRINWQTGQITGNGRLPCPPAGQICPTAPADGDVTILAQFDSNGRFQGTIGGPNGYRGAIAGKFYGPRAIEIAGVMRVAGDGLDETVGSFTARAAIPRAISQ